MATRDKQPDPPANPGGARPSGGGSGDPGDTKGPVASLDTQGGDPPPSGVEPRLVKDAGRSTAPAVEGEPAPTGASALENSGAAPIDFGQWLQAGGGAPTEEQVEKGFGPKVVVLSTGVSGPGGGPYPRGSVIALSRILGPKLMKNNDLGPQHVRRYMTLGAIRPADAEEQKVDFVKLPETETERAETAEAERAKRVEAEERVRDLERQLEEMRAAQSGAGGGSSTSAHGEETVNR
jgi:hypothetical protein